MDKDIQNSAFTFGIFLVIVGLAGRYFEWKQAHIIFIMGVAFEVLALGSYLYKKYKK